MKNSLNKFIVFGLLIFFVLGCSMANRLKSEIDKSQKPQVIASADNSCRITVPGNWQKRTDLHEDATIQAANLVGEQYVIIINESKTDFGKNFNLDSLTRIARDNFKKAAKDPVLTEPVPVTINDYQAREFEAMGEVENLKIKYLYAIVETPNNYYQIITWTLNSRFDKNKANLLEVINSFKEGGEITPALPPEADSNTNN